MRLAPFQKEWIRKSLAEGVNSSLMIIGRGNGKSSLLAGMAVWALYDPDKDSGAAQVPIVATTIGQATRSVYGVALEMIRSEPELLSRCIIYSAIGAPKVVTPDSGTMFPISNDPDGLQGLDFSFACCDEIGFQSIESWDSLLLASGKRPRSLVAGIGTPGFDKHNALWHLRERVYEGWVLPGFVFIEHSAPEGCDFKDEEMWELANPALQGGYMNIDALRTAVALSPESHFRIFRLAQHVDGVECWLGDDAFRLWSDLQDPRQLSPGADSWVGIDVGIKKDSTAVVLLQQRDDGRYHAKAKIWLPTKDEPVDVGQVMQHIRQLSKTYKLRGVSYDPRFFDVPAQMLGREGIPMVEVPQSIERMTPIIGSCYEALRNKQITHDKDDEFRTQVLNAVVKVNERGFTLQKSKSRGRIDAAIALSLAYDRVLRGGKKKSPLVLI